MTFLRSFNLRSRVQTPAPVDAASVTWRSERPSQSVPCASVLCGRVSAKWVRQCRIGVEVRHGRQFEAVRAAGIPAGRLVIHAVDLSVPELLAAAQFAPGHIVVSTARDISVLSMAPPRALTVLLRTADARPAGRHDRRGADTDVAAQVVDHPVLRLAGLHADVGPRSGAYVSIPAAIGDIVAEMADIRDRHGVLMSRVSVGVDASRAGSMVNLTQHTGDIAVALRDACHSVGFPLPSAIVSVADPERGRNAA